MTDQQNPNVLLWDAMKGVDRRFTKPITGKSYKGDSPNPTYIIRKVTEQLGPIGVRWGFNVNFDRVRYGKPHQVMTEQVIEFGDVADENGALPAKKKVARWEVIREEHHELCIRFWFFNDDGTTTTFDAFGGTPMLYMTKNGSWVHDEDAAKKSLTDAYTKAASWLGACADIFLGIFDDKYTSQPHDFGNTNSPPESGQQGDNAPAGGQQPPQGQNGTGDGTPPPQTDEQVRQDGWNGNPEGAEQQQSGRRRSSAPPGWG